MDKDRIKHFAKDTVTTWKWFLWGLRWLATIVFGILFIAGVSVKLPWKILVCLAVIPVISIVVPKKIQPWIWMVLTVALASAWTWVKLPGYNTADWSVYQYDGDLEKLQADWYIDPAANAATRYEVLLEAYGESIFYYPPLDEQSEYATLNHPWKQEDYPRFGKWLEVYAEAVEELVDITQMPECRFAIPQNLPATHVQMKRINRMKGWAYLLLRSANLDITKGRSAEALKKQFAVLGMTQHLYQQKNLLDQASAFHIELLAAHALQTFMIEYCADIETLEVIETRFSQLNPGWAKNWATIVEREKLIAKNVAGLFYEINKEGNTRIAHSAMFALQEGLGFQPRKLFLQQHEMNRLAVIGLWLSLPSSPEGIAGMVDKRFDYYSLQSQKGTPLPNIPIQYSWRMGLNIRSAIDWLAINRVKYFWALHGQNSRRQAVMDLIRIFSSLKKYRLANNNWPDNLQILELKGMETNPVDPVYGKPFFYQTTQDSFRLYSFGPNDIDDDGVNNPRENKDDIVFWPRPITAKNFDGNMMIKEIVK